jgi:hypothetical protein
MVTASLTVLSLMYPPPVVYINSSSKFLGNITQNRYTLLKMTKIQNMEKLEKNSKKNIL